MEGLKVAIEDILVCPACKGALSLANAGTVVECLRCRRAYPIKGGIPVFFGGRPVMQAEECRFRDALAAEQIQNDRRKLLELVGQHHCVPIMQKQAEKFLARFDPREWILDIGIGYGWHWADRRTGARILGIDMSLGNLVLARHLLGEDNHRVVLACADAAALPIRERSISGLWSVQAFQHFPTEVLHSVLAELHRVLGEEFVMEIYNLNPALLLRGIYRLFGKRLHCRGKANQMELNRLSPQGWAGIWKQFRGGRHQISYGYSELFFHPDLRLRPRPYPTKLEGALVKYAPTLTALFARQGQVRIEASGLLVQ